ncbi:uncharacterized protein LOC119766534 [Culex quinquefasciatus]|uniref:uncharacterized protein LOC119766534 n=1 Tax=Culex quinquefasciatus TaxID=7176 RepID=UPI0018E2E8ED|nr:uncharacterized protein LOC119766534 [Culex quinquefasciatus]
MLFCLHPGQNIQGQVRYPFQNDVELRNNESTREHMIEARRQQKDVFGMKGMSVFTTIPNFDVVFGLPLDHMHAALLGVTRHIWNLIMKSDVGTYRQIIEERYLNIKFPSSFSRQPRKFEEEAKFKASEWEHIALYCFYPCFYGFLTEDRLKHFMYFSSSLFTLLEFRISNENLNRCDIWLKKFCARFGSLYGEINETFNVHLMTHMVETVRKQGALWNFSLFPYENGNGILLKYRTGNNKPVLQIAKKYALKKSCHSIPIPYNSPIKKWIDEIWRGKKMSNLLFNEHLRFVIQNEQFEDGIISREFSYHSKMTYHGIQYCTKTYCEDFRYDDSYININDKFIRITCILTDRENSIFVVGRVLKTKSIFPNLYIYKETNQKLVVKLNDSIRQCISITVEVDNESLNCICVCKFSPFVE